MSDDKMNRSELTTTEQGFPESSSEEGDCASKDNSFKEAEMSLTEKVPKTFRVDFSSDNLDEIDEIINRSNAKASTVINTVPTAIINAYVANEKARTKRQKPLLYMIAIFTGLQLLVFNVVIAGAVWLAFKNNDGNVIVQVMSILKYYIGATVAELISMIVFITTATFSKNHVKTMEKLININRLNDKER